ncbi:unnamed protein product [Bemisia tabaci]|uniref:Uncharacterized protein n=1 Tax=Bemisia tabaci TaxID=7038 RepID=A0A9P0C971_BEMTA|nr:unnamed protein product [Bemisia tabaci]
MRKSLHKNYRQKVRASDTTDSSQSEEHLNSKLITQKCSPRNLRNYEKQTMHRGYSFEKKQSHKKKPEAPAREHVQARRSRTKTKESHLSRVKPPDKSDSLYNYAPPSSKPSIENIPKASNYSYSSQEERRYKDSDEEPRYVRETSKYYKNTDGNLNYNRFNPNHNIHRNISPVKKEPSYVRSPAGSNNLLSVREYNKMLNNDSGNSYGYFHGDKNNKLCYISNRPVYYDNTGMGEKSRYRQKHSELSKTKSSDLRIVSKSDTSLAQSGRRGHNRLSDGSDKNIKKNEHYLSKMDRSSKKSHHNENSTLDINTGETNDRLKVTCKNSEITRLTNEIAKKLQNIGLNITAEPLPRSKARRKKEENTQDKARPPTNRKDTESEESCETVPEKDTVAPSPNQHQKEIDIEEEVKRTTEPSKTSRGQKFKHHTKYYVSNPETPEDRCDKCPCNDPPAKQRELHGCCYREGEHVNAQPEHINLKQDLKGCCNPSRNIYENLEVRDMTHLYKPDDHTRMMTHSLINQNCTCAFSEVKCEGSPDAMAKLGLYNNGKRSKSPLTTVNNKTNGVYVFVPLPENSNDPVEMSRHLQNIYNNIIPMSEKQDQKNCENKASAKRSQELSKSESSKGAGEAGQDKTKAEKDTETDRAKLLDKLLDEYNLTQLKQLLEKKAAVQNDDLVEDLKRLKQQNMGRRHSDVNLNLDQPVRSPLRTRKCPSESSFVMKNNAKPWSQNEHDKYSSYNDSRFGGMPEYATPFQQHQSMFPEPPLNNYQSINLPFTEFVSDMSKYRAAPYGTGQAMFYTRTKSPKSYHGTPQPPPVDPNIKPGQPLPSSIIDPSIPFQAKRREAEPREESSLYGRPKSPSQTFNYGLDMATKRHHQQLINHAHHQVHPKASFDPLSSCYPSGEPPYMPSHTHGLYDILESLDDYLPPSLRSPRFDHSPTRFDRYYGDQPSCGHQHKSFKSKYYTSSPPPEPSDFGFEIPNLQKCHNHASRSYYKPVEHQHLGDFRERVHFVDTESRGPSILKKLSDVVAKPFSMLFRVEPENPPRHKSHLKGILKSAIDEEENEDDEAYESYYRERYSQEKGQSRSAAYDLDDMDLDDISQPPLEYVTVVDPFQTDSLESIRDENFGDSASGGKRSPRKNSPNRR